MTRVALFCAYGNRFPLILDVLGFWIPNYIYDMRKIAKHYKVKNNCIWHLSDIFRKCVEGWVNN